MELSEEYRKRTGKNPYTGSGDIGDFESGGSYSDEYVEWLEARAGNGLSYVDIVTKGCDGWLNLFLGKNCIALVRRVAVADKIRQILPEQKTII